MSNLSLDQWLRPYRRPSRAAMVGVEEAAAVMHRTVAEVVSLARAGVLDCHVEDGDVIQVRPVILTTGRYRSQAG